jgi:hypothetical protein
MNKKPRQRCEQRFLTLSTAYPQDIPRVILTPEDLALLRAYWRLGRRHSTAAKGRIPRYTHSLPGLSALGHLAVLCHNLGEARCPWAKVAKEIRKHTRP